MTFFRVLAASIAFTCTGLLAATPAAAQGTAQQRADCTGDAFKFCFADIPNVDKIEACLIRNKSQLSLACQRDFAANPPGRKRRGS